MVHFGFFCGSRIQIRSHTKILCRNIEKNAKKGTMFRLLAIFCLQHEKYEIFTELILISYEKEQFPTISNFDGSGVKTVNIIGKK